MVELVHEIDKALSNPVWEQVRRPPPWEEKSWEDRANEAIAAEAAALAADPEKAEAARREKRVCKCHNVNVGALEDAIKAGNLTSVDALAEATHAGTGCGGCRDTLESMIEAANVDGAVPASIAA
jgi:nitrogenase molybdenum-cofactor synthesis protein NifE